MEEPKVSNVERHEVISKLCKEGEGLAVLFETVATVCQYDHSGSNEQTDGETPGENWKVIGYGIPSIIATKSEVTLWISDFDEDLPAHEIGISNASHFTLLSDHFGVVGEYNNTTYGVSFADAVVAKKIATLLSQVLPSSPLPESSAPTSKRMKLSSSSCEGESDPRGDDEWVVIEQEDAQDTMEDDEMEEVDGDDTGDDTVDGPNIFRRHIKKRRSSSRDSRSPVSISEPTEFRHVSHVDQDTSVSQLTKTMTASVGETVVVPTGPMPIPGQDESGTVESSSFTEVYASGPGGSGSVPPPPPVAPPPPPPVPAVSTLKKAGFQPLVGMSLQDELLKGVTLKATDRSGPDAAGSIVEELKRGIVLRPVGTLGKQLPKPPPLINHSKLLFEISTFKRNALRHVETKNMTDYQKEDPNNLQSLLRSGLEKMKGKLVMRNFSRVGSINGEGDESGFEDEFDGPLFI